jgi:putative transposase
MLAFEHAYNEQHLHSGINFVTPASRHRGEDAALLAQRKAVYEQAKRLNPRRWSGETRNWEASGDVSLNPGKSQEVARNQAAA